MSRQGSVSERIFEPLVDRIKAAGAVIEGGQLVKRVEVDPASGAAVSVVARNRDGQETVFEADAVIFSVGVTGAPLNALCLQALTVTPKFRCANAV